MSGILDSKSRIIDAILTVEGRRQMAEGTFEVSFVTFTDADVVYRPDAENGHEDPTTKIYFEACNLPQDQITFEANDDGKLVPFRSQDVKIPSFSLPGDTSQGTIKNGKLTLYQYHHGRRIKLNTIDDFSSDEGKGFIYSDSTGLTGSVLIKPSLSAGSVSVTAPTPGGPYIGYVGTKGGMSPTVFAQSISGTISKISSLGGPQVPVSAINDSVYLDGVGSLLTNTFIRATGTLSSPLIIEESAIGGNLLNEEVENASFASQIQGILTSSIDNYTDLQCLSTIDRLFYDDEFEWSSSEINSNEMTFDLSKLNQKIHKTLREAPVNLNSIDSMFSDDKFSHLDNFRYLPPIVKVSDTVVPDKSKLENISPYLLGNYPSWGDNHVKMSYKTLIKNVKSFGDIKEPIIFKKTSLNHNVIAQVFEVTDAGVSKLDVVKFGDVRDDAQDASVVTHTVYFVGKTYIDDRGTTVFVNVFTLVFSRYDKSKEVVI